MLPTSTDPTHRSPRCSKRDASRFEHVARTVLIVASLGAFGAAETKASTAEEPALSFEISKTAMLRAWGGGPPETLALDRTIVHSGAGAGRIERDATSAGGFSSFTKFLDLDFTGDRVELWGFLRTEEVDGAAGLWMRQDGTSGSLQFTSMLVEQRAVNGTSDWSEYSIELPLDTGARALFIGALLAGEGTLWVDDLEVLVDGRPMAQAPKRLVEPTVLDTDTEFVAGSGITLPSLSAAQVENVALLGRVWGFLKYHHPRVAAGEIHWDFELFRVLPSVLAASSREARNQVLARWVLDLGVPTECDPCAGAPEDVHLEPPTGWIGDTDLLGATLSGYLNDIHTYRFSGTDSFYVSHVPQVGNPVFPHELAYSNAQPPDAGYRLLALLRLWNIIEYWFPYRDQLDDHWPSVLDQFVPRLASATDWDSYRRELLAFIVRIRDGHANLWGALEVRPPRGECRWPLHLRFIEGRATVTALTPAPLRQKVEVGDVILGIDGTPVQQLIDDWTPYYAASNPASRLRAIALAMPQGACGPSSVQIERKGETLTALLERLRGFSGQPEPEDRPGPTFQRLSKEIAYLKLSSVKAGEVDSYLEQADGTDGLVIDLRNYPSDFVVFALGGRLVDEAVPFARFTRGDAANPGAFTWIPPIVLSPGRPGYPGRVAILVDEVSLSSTEYTAMALRAGPRAVVVGSTTAGADGNVSRIPLPGGLQTMISGIGVFYPDKRPTQRIGIVPDILAQPTVEGIRQGRDDVLEVALRHLLGPEADEAEIRNLAKR